MAQYRCSTCQKDKDRSLFPKQHTSVCLACGRIDHRNRRAAKRERWTHGASGYQNHGCRCEVCRTAWSLKMKARYQEKQEQAAPVSVSWWLERSPDGFTALAIKDHQARMSAARLGQGRRPIGTEEISR